MGKPAEKHLIMIADPMACAHWQGLGEPQCPAGIFFEDVVEEHELLATPDGFKTKRSYPCSPRKLCAVGRKPACAAFAMKDEATIRAEQADLDQLTEAAAKAITMLAGHAPKISACCNRVLVPRTTGRCTYWDCPGCGQWQMKTQAGR